MFSRCKLACGFAMTLIALVATTRAEDAVPATITAFIESVATGASGLYKVDYAAGDEQLRDLPIGVFDSGIGGLTVLEALHSLDMFNNETRQPGADGRPDFDTETFIYLADQANMPYGNYPSANKEPLLRELILRDALFLLGQRYWPSPEAEAPRTDKPRVKAIVIACNTATAYGIADIRRALEQFDLKLPVVGVIEAGSAGVVEGLPSSDEPNAVAILATVGTCSSRAYPSTIARIAGQAGRRVGAIVQQGSVGLAGAIEGDPAYVLPATSGEHPDTHLANYAGPSPTNAKALVDPKLEGLYALDPAGIVQKASDAAAWRLNSVDNYVRYDVASLVEQYRQAGGGKPIATVVLGCTHYPLEQKRIGDAFARVREFKDAQGNQPYQALVAEKLTLVDPARLTARSLYVEMSRAKLHRPQVSAQRPDSFFITVPDSRSTSARLGSDGAFTSEYKIAREPGAFDTEDFRTVPMYAARLLPTAREIMSTRLPQVEQQWAAFSQAK
jgi:glutamate racemase